MKIVIKSSFKRDVDKIHNSVLLEALDAKLDQIERALTIENITGLKLLIGHSTHYRIYLKTENLSIELELLSEELFG